MNQSQQITRVADSIGDVVQQFCRNAQAKGGQFHAQELRDYVATEATTAPASPDRILRLLRSQGRINYIVKDRRASLYEITWVTP